MYPFKTGSTRVPTEPATAAECFDLRFNQAPNVRLFDDLCGAYANHGSVAWSEDLARLMNRVGPKRSGDGLAGLIEADEIFSFQWRDATWIPMVQFNLQDLSVDRRVRSVRQELGTHLDGWEIASWFVCRNSALEGRRPVDLVEDALPAVMQAARADRFVAVG